MKTDVGVKHHTMAVLSSRSVNLSIIIFMGFSWYPIHGFQLADFQSDWLLMQSQATVNYFREVGHGLGEVPLKVKVLVRPLSGVYRDWLFEAGSSQQADDDLPWLYCGILYAYNVTHVNLFAPKDNGGNSGGRAFCIDSASWTSGTNSSTTDQVEQEVLVKILAWKLSSLPAPDMDTGWLQISSRDAPHFVEIPHNMASDTSFIHLQIRCVPYLKNSQTIYAEGTGAGSKSTPNPGAPVISGLVFAYNDTHVRVWIANTGYQYRVLCIRDGYGRDEDGYRCEDGEFRVRGWKSLGTEPQRFRFTLNGLSEDSIPDLSALRVNIKQWDPLTNYVLVEVKALDGPNANFVFPAIGQGHRNAYPESSYGGVVFAYSAENVRLFVPANETGTMIHIPDNWGTAEYVQMSNNVEIIVTMWTTAKADACSGKGLMLGRFSRLPATPCPWQAATKCATSCLSELSCIGTDPCQPDGSCKQMDLDIVNKRLVDGVLGRRGELLLTKLTCE